MITINTGINLLLTARVSQKVSVENDLHEQLSYIFEIFCKRQTKTQLPLHKSTRSKQMFNQICHYNFVIQGTEVEVRSWLLARFYKEYCWFPLSCVPSYFFVCVSPAALCELTSPASRVCTLLIGHFDNLWWLGIHANGTFPGLDHITLRLPEPEPSVT